MDGSVNQQLMQKYNIRGVPTIKFFGADKRKPEDYKVTKTDRFVYVYIYMFTKCVFTHMGQPN